MKMSLATGAAKATGAAEVLPSSYGMVHYTL
jgi:hypothetical protein